MIDNPKFVSLHLSQRTNNQDATHLSVVEQARLFGWAMSLVVKCSNTFLKSDEPCLPWEGGRFLAYKFMGYVNGVMLLLINRQYYRDDYPPIGLLNPSIRKFIEIPPSWLRPTAVGLSFDISRNDYKVVVVGTKRGRDVHGYVVRSTLAYVLTLKTGIWKRKIIAVPEGYTLWCHWSYPVILDRASHCLVSDRPGNIANHVFAFDATTEILNYASIPISTIMQRRSLLVFRKETLPLLDVFMTVVVYG
ncbi:hypothetical protein Droror1_Dr00001901 [Drosera rotundifolia]